MDNDLISRTAAIDALTNTNIKRNIDSVCDGDMNRTRRAAQRVIAQLPAVDAAPVVHGRWMDKKQNSYTRQVTCSVCNGAAPFIGISSDDYGRNMHGGFSKTKYCPHCGALLDGGETTCGPDYCEIGGGDDDT